MFRKEHKTGCPVVDMMIERVRAWKLIEAFDGFFFAGLGRSASNGACRVWQMI